MSISLRILCIVVTLGSLSGGPVSAQQPGARFTDQDIAFPKNPLIVDVTKAPYFAKGDGVTDDTGALQKAISDVMGLNKIVYLPAGTYLVSKTIEWSKKNSAGGEAWGKNWVQGQNVGKTIIKLKDGTAPDRSKPVSIMWCGGFGSADWFHNYVQDITFDVGENNPGAIGLQFYSNNVGAVRNCRFLAGKAGGLTGLDLGHRDMNGPLLIKNCEVVGFERGISSARGVNSQTIEKISLRGQTRVGLENEGQPISIRGLLSENSVPALNVYGTTCLIDSELRGMAGAERHPAIINYNFGRIFLRDVKTSGYARAVADLETPDGASAYRIQGEDKPGSLGPMIEEYSSQTPFSPFAGPKKSPRLKVQEPPEVPIDPVSTWAVVDDFGADPSGNKDSSDAIQKALDSGATTVFFLGNYQLTKPVRVRGKLRRLLGVGAWIDYNRLTKPDLIIEDGESASVTVEHFFGINGGIQIDTSRTVVLRSLEVGRVVTRRKGDLFFEDVVTDGLEFQPGQNIWARQLNVENEGTHVSNNGAKLWVLGYKTERGGTLIHTKAGGISEILGGFSYTTTAGKLAPMFVNEDSSIFAYFAEVCYNGDPFETLIRETRGGQTKVVKRGEGSTTPYAGIAVGK